MSDRCHPADVLCDCKLCMDHLTRHPREWSAAFRRERERLRDKVKHLEWDNSRLRALCREGAETACFAASMAEAHGLSDDADIAMDRRDRLRAAGKGE